MIDLRFVEREVPDWSIDHVVIGQPCRMKVIKILQWRQANNMPAVINGPFAPVWSDWEDVPTEKEDD